MRRGEGPRGRRRLSTERAPSPAIGTTGLQEEAASWALRLSEQSRGSSNVDWNALTLWLEADPAARAALDAAEAALDLLDASETELRASLGRGGARRGVPRPRRWVPWTLAGAGLAAAVWAVAVIVPFRTSGEKVWQAPAGDVLTVALRDGSKVTLDRSARLATSLGGHEREVRLWPGSQALFDVARDPAHPFLIAIGGARIRVLGTLFDVNDTAAGLNVDVARGSVEVVTSSHRPAARVKAGERLTSNQRGEITVAPLAEEIASWRSGELTYVDAPLARLAGDLSRYWRVPVALGPGAEGLRFSGVLVIDTPALMARRLERLAPVVVVKTTSGFVIEKPKAGS